MNNYTVILSEQELSILNEALVNLPYRMVAPLIDRINNQITSGREAIDVTSEQ